MKLYLVAFSTEQPGRVIDELRRYDDNLLQLTSEMVAMHLKAPNDGGTIAFALDKLPVDRLFIMRLRSVIRRPFTPARDLEAFDRMMAQDLAEPDETQE